MEIGETQLCSYHQDQAYVDPSADKSGLLTHSKTPIHQYQLGGINLHEPPLNDIHISRRDMMLRPLSRGLSRPFLAVQSLRGCFMIRVASKENADTGDLEKDALESVLSSSRSAKMQGRMMPCQHVLFDVTPRCRLGKGRKGMRTMT